MDASDTGPAPKASSTSRIEERVVDPAALGWTRVEDDGFIDLVGPFWQRQIDGKIELAFIAQDKHRNQRGIVQGGMLATLLDRAIGMNVRSVNAGRPQATLHLDIHYLDAVEIGSFVVAKCSIERKASSITFASATAYAGAQPVASAKGIWKAMRSQPVDP